MKLHPLGLTVLIGTASVATTLMGCKNDSATTHEEADGKEETDGKDEADGKAKAAGMPDENPVVEIGSGRRRPVFTPVSDQT